MKVLFINNGIAVYTHPMLEKLVKKGCELVMLIVGNDSENIGKNVKLHDQKGCLYKILYSKEKNKWYGKPALIDLKKHILQEKPEIIILSWPYFLQLFFDRSIFRILKKQKIKLVLHEIPFQVSPYCDFKYFKKNPVYNEDMVLQSKGLSFYIRTLFTMFFRKYIYKRANATLNYATHAKEILPSYGIKPESIFVRYNSGDTDALFEAKEIIEKMPHLLEKKERILHVGRLVKWKRVDLLIDAFSIIANKFPKSELVVIGNGPEKENLMKQAEQSGFGNRIVFAGGIYEPTIIGRYMYESTVYVLAGMGGLSINDAMAFSLPIICSVCDGTEKDLVYEGENGYFFEQGNANSLAQSIEKTLSDLPKSREMGLKSLNIIKNKINIDTVSQRYIECFKYVLKK